MRVIVLVGMVGYSYPVVAKDDDHIYCKMTGGADYVLWNTFYYSGVFMGDYGGILGTLGYENDFRDYLKGNEPTCTTDTPSASPPRRVRRLKRNV